MSPPSHRRPRSARYAITPARAAFAGVFAVTALGLLSVGATLPVLPRYVKGPLGGGDLAVGVVIGAFAITGLACRPLAGNLADLRGRRMIVIAGALTMAAASTLYFLPAGVPGLVFARLLLGAGEGMIYTAGAAWIVDLAPADRRGRIIGLYGLAIWGGLSLGPVIGELILHATSFEAVWAFAILTPLLAALVATRIPERFSPSPDAPVKRTFFAPEALRPGLGLALATIGYATMAGFIVLDLDRLRVGHGAAVFAGFAATVVAMRILGGWLPDRIGPLRCAIAAALVESAGLAAIALAHTLAVAVLGAMAMGAAFSLMFPSLALLVVNRVSEHRRGAAMGTFTAFFDLGVGFGGPLAGLAAGLGGYPAAFWFAAACALGSIAVTISLRTVAAALPAPVRA